MLQSVVLQTAVPRTLDIESVNPDDLIIVESISGLDPADVTLFMGDYARNGGYYQGRRSSGRNPVFNLKLNPDYANDIEVSDIREMLYDMFLEPSPTSDELRVVLKDDRKPDRYFDGVTEKLPADIFSRDSKAQVSMLCANPFLMSVDAVVGVDAAGWTSIPVDYEGSAKTGLAVELTVKTDTNQVTVDINGVTMSLVHPTDVFSYGDVININTVDGGRQITWQTPQDLFYIMAMLTPQSRWLQLRKGINTIQTYGSVVGDGKAAMTAYGYRAAWWGI